MNYSKTFGKVIKYLEELVVSGDEIDYEEIGRIVVAPVALFQRIFVFISNVTIAEYVRKRRLTQAGLDLKKGNDSVIDIAFKYGFHSHSAFSRAFKVCLTFCHCHAIPKNFLLIPCMRKSIR